MFKQTLLALAIGTLVGFASPQVMAEPLSAEAKELQDTAQKAQVQALEKEAQVAKDAGDEKRAATFEQGAKDLHQHYTAGTPLPEKPNQTPAEAAVEADIHKVAARGAAEAIQEKANEPGASDAVKTAAAHFSKEAEGAEKSAEAAHKTAEEAATKDQAEAAAKAEPAAEPAAEATPEPAAEPVAETASEPAAEAAPEPAAESSGGE
jgi:hypothetical protein